MSTRTVDRMMWIGRQVVEADVAGASAASDQRPLPLCGQNEPLGVEVRPRRGGDGRRETRFSQRNAYLNVRIPQEKQNALEEAPEADSIPSGEARQ
jgi:hypothetical protein